MHWDLLQVTVLNLLCFLECFNYNGVKQPQMANYLSAIKTHFLLCGLDVACFTDARIKLYLKAVQRLTPLQIKLNKIIEITMLLRIVEQFDYSYMGQIFKALFLLSLYPFLCISNLVPHAVSKFSPLKYLARGMLFFDLRK